MHMLTGTEEYEKLRRQVPLLVVQFGSDDCAPCKAIREKLDRWSAGRPGTFCLYAGLENFPALAAQEGIFTAPAVVIFAQGKKVMQEAGYFSLDALLRKAERCLEMME